MSDPHITILMATFNGAQFLPAQLDSLLCQTHTNWSLAVSDDGSSDTTLPILRDFGRAYPDRNLTLITGHRQRGATQNFMSLLLRHDLPRGMVALADQDDVWLPGKLARAAASLQNCPKDQPAIYASESLLTDENLVPLRQPKQPAARPNFRNALVQNLFAGHSTALNAAAVDLIKAVGTPQTIAFHDWWLYQLVAGAGGTCVLDPAQTVLYRQHRRNAFGASSGLGGAIKRLSHLVRNDYGAWLGDHWRALQEAAQHLTPEARDLITDLLAKPAQESRTAQFRRLQLHRSSAKGTAALHLAAYLGWV